VLVYVDDLILAAAELKEIIWIKTALAKAFQMTDLGELKTFLGLEMSRERNQRLLTLHQKKYINKILQRHRMEDTEPSYTLLDPGKRLPSYKDLSPGQREVKTIDTEVYQSAVRSLMYAMLGTRPDIAYSVGLVSQFNHAPVWEHWIVVK